MDKTALGMIIAGIILLVAGVYGAYFFLDELIFVIKGLIGLIVILIGLLLLAVGIMTAKD
ncbi:MAG: hypothetical protein JXQ82_02570 [Methanomicrobiaceae archaeon]|nr:hypothetical protein [Methanomicrobiaceae archaeon]